MSRMYSRKKGSSGSTKPEELKKPEWTKLSEKEVETLIVKLAKEGKSSAQIGTLLRDQYGIVDVKTVTGKRISEILEAKKVAPELPDDLLSLIRRSVAIRKHLQGNHKDQTAKRGLTLTESKIRRLVKYYKANKVLPLDWKFDPESVKIYAQ
ncbi:MAG: 30S ribosomal protein S15 [Candidatus Nanoarchaeia archaeon]